MEVFAMKLITSVVLDLDGSSLVGTIDKAKGNNPLGTKLSLYFSYIS